MASGQTRLGSGAGGDSSPVEPNCRLGAPTVLVVGGAGYIGSVLVRDLLADGYRVRVLDSLLAGGESIRGLEACRNFELVEGDLRRRQAMVEAAQGATAVIHLGALVGDPACAADEEETVATNLAAIPMLAAVARASGVTRFLFASTCSVYGAADHLVDERSPLNPVSLYAATKRDAEKILLAAQTPSFDPVVLRLASAFGWSPRPRFDLVVNLLTARAWFGRKIQICNAGQWRPFIHVSDISRAFGLALEAPVDAVGGEIFNVGSSAMNYTLGDLGEQITRRYPGVSVGHVRDGDARSYRVGFDKFRDRLGFECRVGLAEGIAEVAAALGQGRIRDYRDSRYHNVELARRRAAAKTRDDFELAPGAVLAPFQFDAPPIAGCEARGT